MYMPTAANRSQAHLLVVVQPNKHGQETLPAHAWAKDTEGILPNETSDY